MKKLIGKIIAIAIAGSVVFTSTGLDTAASSMTSLLPVAGTARALSEGKSVVSVKADKIKSDSSDESVLLTAGATSEYKSEDYSYSKAKKASTIKETASTSDPALITVGAASATVNETISQNLVLDSSINLESYVEANGTRSEDEESVDESILSEDELVTVQTKDTNTEEEDFTNLVIAQVHDYVNVRSEASEDSEIVGKLYNKSVGDLLEEDGEWYKIRSGSCTGYVKGEYVVTGEEAQDLAKEVGTRLAKVTTTTLYVRADASTDAEVIGMVPIDDELLVLEELDEWAKVSIEEGEGYVSLEYVKLFTEFVRAESKEEEEARLAREEAEREAAREAARRAEEKAQKNRKKNETKNNSQAAPAYVASGSGTGSSVANYALQFVGNPYVYGGSSLTNGTDCSGFVMSVYRNFGVSLPHSSGGDRNVGYNVGGLENAQPGDIVCYSGHVAIYIGNGQIVHASTPATGIKVSNASYRNVLAVRRIF